MVEQRPDEICIVNGSQRLDGSWIGWIKGSFREYEQRSFLTSQKVYGSISSRCRGPYAAGTSLGVPLSESIPQPDQGLLSHVVDVVSGNDGPNSSSYDRLNRTEKL